VTISKDGFRPEVVGGAEELGGLLDKWLSKFKKHIVL
jgi:hypothetical protein